MQTTWVPQMHAAAIKSTLIGSALFPSGPACALQETMNLEKTWTAVLEWDTGYATVRGLQFAQLQLPALRAMGNRIAAILAMKGVESWPVWRDVHVRLLPTWEMMTATIPCCYASSCC